MLSTQQPLSLTTAGRVVAIGDIHGDRAALARTLSTAGLLDDDARGPRWIGGDATLVQLGDVLDRGAEEAACVQLLRRLRREAPAHGGAVVGLLGNHEVMNVCGLADPFVHAAGREAFGPDRRKAFLPGGALATELAECRVAVIVNDSCFVHAHLPADATLEGLDALNDASRRWLLGEKGAADFPLSLDRRYSGDDSPIWGRALSSPSNAQVPRAQCDSLRRTLARLGVARLVVGHTPQRFINAACDGLVWRCDTGMSRHVAAGACEALEISSDGAVVRILRDPAAAAASTPHSLAAPRIAAAAAAAASGEDSFYDIF